MGSMELVASAMGEEGHLPWSLNSCKPSTFGKENECSIQFRDILVLVLASFQILIKYLKYKAP